jgi:tetratricopeptide (TPR) repeat protein
MLFNRLSIFASGYSLEAATTVCGGEGLDEIEILDLLTSLTDKSLVVAETGGELERYHLLESTRAYALEKLTKAGNFERQARRHAEYFCNLAQQVDESYGFGSNKDWLEHAELELDNFRAALEWALTRSNSAALGGAIVGALGHLWREGGLAAEGRWWINTALEREPVAESPTIAARLWLAQANLTSGKERCDSAQHACALYETANDSRGFARALYELALGFSQTGQFDVGRDAIEKALETARTCKDELYVANCLRRRSVIFGWLSDAEASRAGAQEALAAFNALGNEKAVAEVFLALGETYFHVGDERGALRYASDAIAILSKGRHTSALAMVQNNAAAYNVALDALDEAHKLACESLRVARDVQDELQFATALQHLATIAALRGEAKAAARLRGFVDAAYRALGYKRELTERWGNDKLMGSLSERLSEAEIEKLAADGAAWSEDQAVEEALKG